jgi:hypothetical protein
VPVQGYICRQPRVVGVVNGLVEGEVQGGVFEEEPEVCVVNAWILREIRAVAGGTVNPPGIDLAIRCLLPQLPRDSQMRPKAYVGQGDWA